MGDWAAIQGNRRKAGGFAGRTTQEQDDYFAFFSGDGPGLIGIRQSLVTSGAALGRSAGRVVAGWCRPKAQSWARRAMTEDSGRS